MRNKKQNRFLKFLKEIAIIVIGVLIAVSINKVKENSDNKKYISKTLNAIQKEIDYSSSEIEGVLTKHLLLVDSLTTKLDKQETLSEIIYGSGGLQFPETQNIGLRFFVSSKADLIDHEVISKLSSIEGSSNLLYVKMRRLTDFIFENTNKKDRLNKEVFLMHLKNVIDSEMQLLELYASFSGEAM